MMHVLADRYSHTNVAGKKKRRRTKQSTSSRTSPEGTIPPIDSKNNMALTEIQADRGQN